MTALALALAKAFTEAMIIALDAASAGADAEKAFAAGIAHASLRKAQQTKFPNLREEKDQ